MMATTILICDDDPVQRRLLSAAVTRLGYGVETVARPEEAQGGRPTAGAAPCAVALIALDGDAARCRSILAALPDLARSAAVVVQVSADALDKASEGLNLGAVDFIVKPVTEERLRVSISNALKRSALEQELRRVRRSAHGQLSLDDVIAVSPSMARAVALAGRATATRNPVMLEGERGVGKALLAQAIQGSGEFRSRPFVAVDCGSLTEENAVHRLFGDTGAQRPGRSRNAGHIGAAQGGTLFLDGVDRLPRSAQLPLLDAIRTDDMRLTEPRRRPRADFRVISTAGPDLLEKVRRGDLREDLYYRLNVFPIRIPPLRERVEDIPELARHFVVRFAAEEGKGFMMGLSEAAVALIVRHGWPGNVAQLESAIFHAVALADGPFLTPNEFPRLLSADALALSQHQTSLLKDGAERRFKADRADLTAYDRRGDVRRLADIEAEVIRLAVGRYGGRMTMVARKLGIGRSTLYRKLRDLGLLEADVGTAAE